MAYLGSWKEDDWLTFPANTHDPADGSATDADALPTYRIYEDETSTPLRTGTMTKLDDANTTGFYHERVQLTGVTAFEQGKCYTIYIEATVNGVMGTMSHTFQMIAEVNVRTLNMEIGLLSPPTPDTIGDALKKASRLEDAAIVTTVSDGTPTAGEFDLAASLSDDQLNGMVLVFLDGTLQGQNRKISDTIGAGNTVKFEGATGEPDAPFPSAPSNGDEVMIIGRMA